MEKYYYTSYVLVKSHLYLLYFEADTHWLHMMAVSTYVWRDGESSTPAPSLHHSWFYRSLLCCLSCILICYMDAVPWQREDLPGQHLWSIPFSEALGHRRARTRVRGVLVQSTSGEMLKARFYKVSHVQFRAPNNKQPLCAFVLFWNQEEFQMFLMGIRTYAKMLREGVVWGLSSRMVGGHALRTAFPCSFQKLASLAESP